MKTETMQAEALSRAQSGASFSNYSAIYAGFLEMGLVESEILPRINVLTFNAWKAKGRQVRKGEHGVKITTYIPVPEKRDDAGDVTRAAGRRPKTATVFHVSQTDGVTR